MALVFTPKGLYPKAQGREALRAHPGLRTVVSHQSIFPFGFGALRVVLADEFADGGPREAEPAGRDEPVAVYLPQHFVEHRRLDGFNQLLVQVGWFAAFERLHLFA